MQARTYFFLKFVSFCVLICTCHFFSVSFITRNPAILCIVSSADERITSMTRSVSSALSSFIRHRMPALSSISGDTIAVLCRLADRRLTASPALHPQFSAVPVLRLFRPSLSFFIRHNWRIRKAPPRPEQAQCGCSKKITLFAFLFAYMKNFPYLCTRKGFCNPPSLPDVKQKDI